MGKGAKFTLEEFQKLSQGKGVKGVEIQDQKKKQVVKSPTAIEKRHIRVTLDTDTLAIRCADRNDNRFQEVRFIPITENTTIRAIKKNIKDYETANPDIIVKEINIQIL